MTSESFLLARGWRKSHPEQDFWVHPLGLGIFGEMGGYKTEQALKAQLDLDTRCLAFALERVALTATWPKGNTVAIDLRGAVITWRGIPDSLKAD